MNGDDQPWWRRPFSTFQTNLQDIDAAMDVAAELDAIEAFGADTWLINTGGITSFYPSELSFQTPSPYLDRRASGDLIGDAVREAHARGIRVIARVDLSKVESSIAAEHPEWLFVSAEGESQVYQSLYSTCPNREYWQARSFDIIGEILARYPVDGFFFNWFSFNAHDYSGRDHGVCQCEQCSDRFRAFSGGDSLPTAPESAGYARWQEFSARCITDLAGRLAEEIDRIAPGTPLILQRGTPLPYGEVGNSLSRGFWPHASGDIVSVRKSVDPETPVLMLLVSFLDIAYRLAGDQPARFLQYQLQAIARGANPCTYIIGVPSRVPYPHLEAAGAVNRHFRAHEDVYAGLHPAAPVALVRPQPTLRSAGYEGDSDPSLPIDEYRGIHRALQERHRLFDTIDHSTLARLSDEQLDRFDAIILPALGELGSVVARSLDEYVRRGGSILLTGDSGLAGARPELAAHPAAMLAGPAESGQSIRSVYALPNQPSGERAYAYSAPVLPAIGELRRYRWQGDAQTFGVLTSSAPWGPPEKSYGHRVTTDAIGACRGFGKGSVAAVTVTLGAAYTAAGTTEIRDTLIDVLDAVAAPTLETDMPEQIEIVSARSGNRTVLHVINQTGIRHNTVLGHVPVHDATIRIRVDAPTAMVRLLIDGRHERARADADGFVAVRIARLELFEVIVLEAVTADF